MGDGKEKREERKEKRFNTECAEVCSAEHTETTGEGRRKACLR